jgi:hypothetical protein
MQCSGSGEKTQVEEPRQRHRHLTVAREFELSDTGWQADDITGSEGIPHRERC